MREAPNTRLQFAPAVRGLAIFAAVLLASLCAAVAVAQTLDPATMPARASHGGLTIAVDPYVDRARVKEKFGKKHPYDADLLPVEVYFKNETNFAVRVYLEDIRLVIAPPEGGRQRLEPMGLATVIEKTLHQEKGGPEVTKPRLPIPLPRSGSDRSKEWKKLEESWNSLLLADDVLPPQSTIHGFLFFDMGRHMDWAPYSRLLIPRLKSIESNQELFFFEVDLAKVVPKP